MEQKRNTNEREKGKTTRPCWEEMVRKHDFEGDMRKDTNHNGKKQWGEKEGYRRNT